MTDRPTKPFIVWVHSDYWILHEFDTEAEAIDFMLTSDDMMPTVRVLTRLMTLHATDAKGAGE